MPQTVEIPGRGVAEFPDEMSPDEIKGVIRQKFYSEGKAAASAPAEEIKAAPSGTTSDTAGYLPNVTALKAGRIEAQAGEPIGSVLPRALAPTQDSRALQVHGESGKSLLGTTEQIPTSPDDSLLTSAGKGIVNVGNRTMAGLTTPEMVGLLPIAGAEATLGKLAAGAFGAQAATQIPGQVEKAITAPTAQGKIEGGLEALLSSVFAVGGGAHATGSLGKVLAPILGEPEAAAPIAQPEALPAVVDEVIPPPEPIKIAASSEMTGHEPVTGEPTAAERVAAAPESPVAAPEVAEPAVTRESAPETVVPETSTNEATDTGEGGGGETVTPAEDVAASPGETPVGATDVPPVEPGSESAIANEAAPTATEPGATSDESTAQLNQEPETFNQPSPEPGATGIAQRVHDERAQAGAIGAIEPGEGVSAEEMVNRGRQLVADGADPEAISARIKETKQVSADDVAVLRAHMEELSKATNAAGDALASDPKNPELKTAYEDAFKAETDWAQNHVKPAQTEWHKAGMAMQGETAIDTGTFTGLRRAFRDAKGRDATPAEQAKLQKVADKNKAIDSEVAAAKDAYDKTIESAVAKTPTTKRLPVDAESLRSHFAERLKALLPCEV